MRNISSGSAGGVHGCETQKYLKSNNIVVGTKPMKNLLMWEVQDFYDIAAMKDSTSLKFLIEPSRNTRQNQHTFF